ncbi:putative bifunctional diguanylate cyclase/phosphodiesterase [Cytobacillus sp. FJAT-54145]|uniref:Bifunctional diguanylate cyclase/phosphodiesterase n=1 Tax=Cytobacillus spartinae TaxID=3299023 RepID=A0ABW6K9U7_9BACI
MKKPPLFEIRLLNDLPHALKRREFELYFQPQFDVSTLHVTGAETLIRWNHPLFGTLSPQAFLPLLEYLHLDEGLDAWVLKEACKQNKQWQQAGLPPIKIGVNAYTERFEHPNWSDLVKSALEESELDGQWLEIEMTEHSKLTSIHEAYRTIQALDDLGVQVALDDFGTGHASLFALKVLPFHTLKLDKSFLQNLDETKATTLAESVVQMAKRLNLTMVAEGVEEEDQLIFLKTQGCHQAQGYYLGKPMNQTSFATFLKQQNA